MRPARHHALPIFIAFACACAGQAEDAVFDPYLTAEGGDTPLVSDPPAEEPVDDMVFPDDYDPNLVDGEPPPPPIPEDRTTGSSADERDGSYLLM
ncbi:MAG: hypothetical protein KC416_05715, partial [Myxococcales bacterium]|nr:hypothetical protein [Myxococcales bacterium]